MRKILTVTLVLLLVACSPRGEITYWPEAAKVGDARSVFVATTRGFDTETGELYGIERSPSARFGWFEISVPPERVAGKITWPKRGRPADPQTEFLTTRQDIYDTSAEFRENLSRALREDPRGKREAIIFVHGFNNTFAEGLYRVAQLSHDLELPGVTVHYSWPSRANPLGYAYDRDSALFARDGLQELIDQVSAAGADRIVIVAHSMGAALTMESLRQMVIGGDSTVRNKIAGVVLISPDIDIDVFHAQAVRIGTLPQPFLIFTSKKDRALALSARLTGQRERLGNIRDVDRISDLKVTLLDVSAFTEGLGHFAVGDSAVLLKLLGRLTDVDNAFSADPTGRTGLLPGAVLTVQNATQIVLSPVTAIATARQ